MSQERVPSILLARVVWSGGFLGLVATIYFLAGRVGYVQAAWLNGATAAGAMAAALFALFVFFSAWSGTNRLGKLLGLFVSLILLIEVLLGLLPPTARDELTHHLAMPRLYVGAGRIFDVPFAPYSYYPMLLDMLYVPFVKWGWDSLPKIVHGLYGFMTALLIYAHLGHRLNSVYGLLGAFLFISTPAVLRLSHWAYVDLGLTFYSTASLFCLIQWAESGYARSWWVLAALSAGFAFATKPNGMLSVFLLACFSFWLAGKREQSVLRSIGVAACFVVVALVAVGPWLAKNFSETGNPLYPLFGSFFAASAGGGGGSGGPELSLMGRRRLLYGESWGAIAALPLRVFFSGRDDQPQHFDGVLNPMLVLFLPWAFKGKWLEEKKPLAAFAFFYFSYAFFWSDMRIRYILPIVPPLVVLLVYALHNMYLRVARTAILYGAVVLLVALNGIYLWRHVEAVSPLAYLARKESRDSYLARTLPDYPVFQYVNLHLPKEAKIYFIFMGRRGYYCDRSYFHDPGEHPWFLVSILKEAQGPEGVYDGLTKAGITHLLAREDLWRRFLSDNITPEQHKMWEFFAARHLVGLYRNGDYSVYELRS